MEKIKELVSDVLNPVTGKSLGSENRIKDVVKKGDDTHITINRDGISPAEKKKIEDEIFKVL
jgi:ATP-binding protein involved in chromosome partitioning